MNEQPEALRCAEALERAIKQIDAEDNVVHVARWFAEEAAAELCRLHSVNAQLLEALENLLWYVGQLEIIVYSADDTGEHEEVTKARAAIAVAKGEA